MHLRRERKKLKSGTRTYLSVAHSVVERPEGKPPRPKPVVLMNLGNEADLDPGMVKGIIGVLHRYVEERLAKEGKAKTPLEAAEAVAEELGPKASGLQRLLSKSLGLRPILEAVWKDLKLGATLRLFQREHKIKFAFERLIFGLVWNRLVDPKSKLAANEWLKDEAYFPEGEGLKVQHYYRALDILERYGEPLQARLLEAFRRVLPEADWQTLGTDTTSTYVESSLNDEDRAEIAEEWRKHDKRPEKTPEPVWPRPQVVNDPPLRMQGHSKDERPRSPQVVIGVVTNRDGLVLYHKVFPGNRADGQAALDLVDDFEDLVSLAGKTWIGDSGMGTNPVLAELDARRGLDRVSAQSLRRKFIRRRVLGAAGRYREHPTRKGWSYRVVEVSAAESPHGRAEQWIVTRNDRDRKRRLGLLEKHVARVEKALAIDDRLDGKVKGVFSIVSNKGLKKFVKRLKSDRGRYRLNKKRIREERRTAGLAAICATNTERSPVDVIADYRSLWKTEASFRTFKGPVGLRPMYHRASRRIRAHVLLCAISVNVMLYLEKKLGQRFSAIKKAWATSTACLMTRGNQTWWQREVHTAAQAAMLEKLGARPGPEIWNAKRTVGAGVCMT
jgi:hypothetical protein